VYMTLDSTLAALSSEIIGQIVENLALHLKISATQLTLGVLWSRLSGHPSQHLRRSSVRRSAGCAS
jgi:hypothetical protein